MDTPVQTGKIPAVIAGVKTVWWVGMGILLVVLAAQADPKLGGMLLIVIVMGMVWAARERKDALGHPLI
jgi:hypothetical protein